MSQIPISEEFKETIAYFIEKSETNRVDHILRHMIESGYIDEEYGHLIFAGDIDGHPEYDVHTDLIVIDAIEDEIKRQLLEKFDKIN